MAGQLEVYNIGPLLSIPAAFQFLYACSACSILLCYAVFHAMCRALLYAAILDSVSAKGVYAKHCKATSHAVSPGHVTRAFCCVFNPTDPSLHAALTPVVCSQCVKILCCCVAVCGAGFPGVRAAFYICWSAVPHLLRCKFGCCLVAVLETHGAVPGHSAVHPGAYCASWQSQVCCAATNAGHSNSSNSETSIRFSVSARMLTSCTNRLTLHALSIHYIMDFDKNYCRLAFVRPH